MIPKILFCASFSPWRLRYVPQSITGLNMGGSVNMSDKKPWPSDAVMIIASRSGEEIRETMKGPYRCRCRDCDLDLVADTFTVSYAEKHPLRQGRPIKFFCMKCYLNYEMGEKVSVTCLNKPEERKRIMAEVDRESEAVQDWQLRLSAGDALDDDAAESRT